MDVLTIDSEYPVDVVQYYSQFQDIEYKAGDFIIEDQIPVVKEKNINNNENINNNNNNNNNKNSSIQLASSGIISGFKRLVSTTTSSPDPDKLSNAMNLKTQLFNTIFRSKTYTEFAPRIYLFLACLGLATALLSFLVERGLFYLRYTRLQMSSTGIPFVDYLIWIISASICIVAAAACGDYISVDAQGSGIAEMKVVLSGVWLKNVLTLKTFVAKVIGLIFAVSSGIFFGKLGPDVHFAVLIANQLCRFPCFTSIQSNPSYKHQLLTSSVAAGVTSSFGTPIGGVIYGIETTSTYFMVYNLWRGFFAAIVSVVAFHLFRGKSNISYTYFRPWSISIDLIFFGILGLMVGVISAYFIKWFIFIQNVKKGKPERFIFTWLMTGRYRYSLAIAISIALLTYPFPALFQGMNGVVNDSFLSYSLTNPIDPVTALKWGTHGIWFNLIFFSILIFIFSPLSVAVPVPGGVFMPAFALGASFGRLFGEVVYLFYTDIQPGWFAVAGAAAMIASLFVPPIFDVMINLKELPMISLISPDEITNPVTKASNLVSFIAKKRSLPLKQAFLEKWKESTPNSKQGVPKSIRGLPRSRRAAPDSTRQIAELEDSSKLINSTLIEMEKLNEKASTMSFANSAGLNSNVCVEILPADVAELPLSATSEAIDTTSYSLEQAQINSHRLNDMGVYYDPDLEFEYDDSYDEAIEQSSLIDHLRKNNFLIDETGEVISDAQYLTTSSTVLDAYELLSNRNYLHIPIVENIKNLTLIGSVPRARLHELIGMHDELVREELQEAMHETFLQKFFGNMNEGVEKLKENYFFEQDEHISSVSYKWIEGWKKKCLDTDIAHSEAGLVISNCLECPIYPMLGTTVDTSPFTVPDSCPLKKIRYYFAILSVFQIFVVEVGGKLLGVIEKRHLAEFDKSQINKKKK